MMESQGSLKGHGFQRMHRTASTSSSSYNPNSARNGRGQRRPAREGGSLFDVAPHTLLLAALVLVALAVFAIPVRMRGSANGCISLFVHDLPQTRDPSVQGFHRHLPSTDNRVMNERQQHRLSLKVGEIYFSAHALEALQIMAVTRMRAVCSIRLVG